MKKTRRKEAYFAPEPGINFFTGLKENALNTLGVMVRRNLLDPIVLSVHFIQSPLPNLGPTLIVTDNCKGVHGPEGEAQFFEEGKREEDKDAKTWSEYGVGWAKCMRFLVKKHQNSTGLVSAIYVPNADKDQHGWVAFMENPDAKTYEEDLWEYKETTLKDFRKDFNVPDYIKVEGVTYVVNQPCLELPSGKDLENVFKIDRKDKRNYQLWTAFNTSFFPTYGENYYHLSQLCGFKDGQFDIKVINWEEEKPQNEFSLLDSVKNGWCTLPIVNLQQKNTLSIADLASFEKPTEGKEVWTWDIKDKEGNIIYDKVSIMLSSRVKSTADMIKISDKKGKQLDESFEETLDKRKKYADNKWMYPSGKFQTHLTKVYFGGVLITVTSKILPLLSSLGTTEGDHQGQKWTSLVSEIHFDGEKRPKTTGTKVELDDTSFTFLEEFLNSTKDASIVSLKKRAVEIRDTIKPREDMKGFSEENLENTMKQYFITAEPNRQYQVPIGDSKEPQISKNPLKVDSGIPNERGGLDYMETKKGQLTGIGPQGISEQLFTYGTSMNPKKDRLSFIGESIDATARHAAERARKRFKIDVDLKTFEDYPVVHTTLELRAQAEGVIYPSGS